MEGDKGMKDVCVGEDESYMNDDSVIVGVDRNAQIALAELPYLEYLSSDYWKDLRKTYYANRPKECFVCKRTKNLHLHHFDYEVLGKETYGDIVCLCKRCHATVHNASTGLGCMILDASGSRGMLTKTMETAELAKKDMGNELYTMFLPFTKINMFTIETASIFWNITTAKTKKLINRAYDMGAIRSFQTGGKGSPEYFFIDRLIWYLIEFEYPQIEAVGKIV